MYLRSLYLRNFRNYLEEEIRFSPRLNVIWGKNAQGKTNLLEAVYFIASGRSFRTQHLSDLIREKESFFYLEAEIEQLGTIHSVKISFDGQNKRLQQNATIHSSFTPLLGSLPLVLHVPGDAELITGSPSLRRRFLNLHLAQKDPLYVHHLTRFWRAMKQRNYILRSRGNEPIECWEEEMAHSATYLHQTRKKLIEELKSPLASYSRDLSENSESHELLYHPSSPENYLTQLAKNRARERDLGLTLTGPHRDELSFWIDGKASRLFASEGQKKTSIASLRLAEWDLLAARFNSSPIMAIDDLGLFLDEARQTEFRERLAKLGQVFVTTPSSYLDQAAHKIEIQNGKNLLKI